MMIRRSKQDTAVVEGAISRAVNYEVTVADLARKSQRRAWWVAGTSLAVTLIMAGSIFAMLPLKEREPYLVVLDPVTGNAQVSRLVASAVDGRLYADQAIARSNIHRFVVARESYDYDLMMTSQSGDWKLPFLMSTGSVSTEMRALWSPTNPGNPGTLYGRDKAVRIRIQSIVLERVGGAKREGAATVRFQRLLFDKKSGGTRVIDNKIAMLEFEYNPNLRLSDADRVQNPLGFQVKTYRVDSDAALATPEQVMLPADPVADPYAQPTPAQAVDANGTPIDAAMLQQIQQIQQMQQMQQMQQAPNPAAGVQSMPAAPGMPSMTQQMPPQAGVMSSSNGEVAR
jgi:type IV secretion system protein VirB8